MTTWVRCVVAMAMWATVARADTAGPGWRDHGVWEKGEFFPIAAWLQQPANAGKYKALGVNLYVGLWKGPTEAQLAELEKWEMPVICGMNDEGARLKGNRMIVGWMHGDEPDNAQSRGARLGFGAPIEPAVIVKGYEEVKRVDPDRPVLLNLGQGVAWDGWYGRGARTNHPEDYPQYVKGCDIASFDIYPVTHTREEVAGKIEFVGRGVDRLIKWSDAQKPIWACIETTHIGNENALPTPGQVRSEVWSAITHGARGIIYFCHEFKPKFIEAGLLAHPEIAGAVKEVNGQIRELAVVLNGKTEEGVAKATGGAVTVMVKRRDGATYLFAASDQPAPARVTLELTGVKGPGEVLWEGRSVDAAGGRFEDAFDGYGVHVYKFTP